MPDAVRLLLVEDDRVLRMDLEDTLRSAGYEALVATNGEQAAVALEAAGAELRALVTSVQLSDGPGGWEIARRARKLKPVMPVIYISGASPDEWAVHGVPNSILLEKPFAAAQVVIAVSMLLLRATAG